MPYCPKCRSEYEPEISICPDCEVDLTAEVPPQIPTEYEDAEWVELYTFPGLLYANMAIELLFREEVPCYTQSYYAGAALGPHDAADFVGSTATLFVMEPDYERAREIIEPMIDEIPAQTDDEESEDQ